MPIIIKNVTTNKPATPHTMLSALFNTIKKSILIKQLTKMASGLWHGIAWPSAVITLGMGVSLLVTQPAFLQYGFMHIKLTLVFFLYVYHFSIHYLFVQFKRGVLKFSSTQMRLWNEVATLFLISIVFLIVLKSALSIVWGVAGLLVVTFLIMMGIRIYKKYRNEQ